MGICQILILPISICDDLCLKTGMEFMTNHRSDECFLFRCVCVLQIDLENRMSEAKVIGFGRVLCANSYREGKSYAIQSSGLGSLEPNTVVLGWPTKWAEEGHADNAEVHLPFFSTNHDQ